jgi:hypothetical protein
VDLETLSLARCRPHRVLTADQGRDVGIGVFQAKTRAAGDDSAGLGGRRGDVVLRLNRDSSVRDRDRAKDLFHTTEAVASF